VFGSRQKLPANPGRYLFRIAELKLLLSDLPVPKT
jgi:hypothetical protein